MGLWGELLFLLMNSQLPRFTAHTPLRGRRKKMQLEDKVCISVRAEQESAGTSLLTWCFWGCFLVARHVWCQPRSPEQSQSLVFAQPVQLREVPTKTPVLPLCSVSLEHLPLSFFLDFLMFWLFIPPRAAHRVPVKTLKKPCPTGHTGTVISGGSSVGPGNPPRIGHCWSKKLECTGLWSPLEWMWIHYLWVFLMFASHTDVKAPR